MKEVKGLKIVGDVENIYINSRYVYVRNVVKQYNEVTSFENLSSVEVEEKKEYKITEYNEIQYTKDEYIEKLTEENENLKGEVNDVTLLIADIIGGV